MNLDARRERWYGSFGLYSSGTTAGIVAEEAQYNFASVPDFLTWVHNLSPQPTYNDTGYVVGLGRAPNGNTDIVVYRACIGGQPPTRLPGSHDTDVTLGHDAATGPSQSVAWYGCAHVVYDPDAEAKQRARSTLDIARQVDYWGLTGFSCPITGSGDATTSDATPTPGDAELVMRPGDRLTLHNRTGTLTIHADEQLTRVFDWQNDIAGTAANGRDDLEPHTLGATLAQAQERVAGARGMYGCRRKAGDEHYTLDYVEAQLNFHDLADFSKWLTWPTHGPLYMDYVYRNDGLLAGYEVGSDSGATPRLDVDLYRICIAGSPPTHLPGANDSALQLVRAKVPAGVKSPPPYACALQEVPYGDAYAAARAHYQFDSYR